MKGLGKPTRRDKSILLLIYEHTQLQAAIVVTASITYLLFVDRNKDDLHSSIIK